MAAACGIIQHSCNENLKLRLWRPLLLLIISSSNLKTPQRVPSNEARVLMSLKQSSISVREARISTLRPRCAPSPPPAGGVCACAAGGGACVCTGGTCGSVVRLSEGACPDPGRRRGY